jgi:hypothetical protein
MLRVIRYNVRFALAQLNVLYRIVRMLLVYFKNPKTRYGLFFPGYQLYTMVRDLEHGRLRRFAARQERYASRLARMRRDRRDGARPVRVGFLVPDLTFWCYDHLLGLLRDDPRFEVGVVVAPQIPVAEGVRDRALVLERYRRTQRFFEERGGPVTALYDEVRDEWRGLEGLEIDVLVYTIAGALPRRYEPQATGEYLIPVYIPYGIMTAANRNRLFSFQCLQFNKDEHNFMWKVFLESKRHLEMKRCYCDLKDRNAVVTGHPRLDGYRPEVRAARAALCGRNAWPAPAPGSRKRIIWAPHFTIEHLLDASTFGGGAIFATFHQNGRFFPELFRRTPEVHWCFKPHPLLMRTVVEYGFMSRVEVEAYFQEMASLPNVFVFDEGEYIDLFLESDALITDSVSFLAEYALSGHPILFLRNRFHAFNEFGQELTRHYYGVRGSDRRGIRRFVERVVLGGNDRLCEKRRQSVEAVLPMGEISAGARIKACLIEAFLGDGAGDETGWIDERYATGHGLEVRKVEARIEIGTIVEGSGEEVGS